MSCRVPAPTVPSPATAILSGAVTYILRRRSWQKLHFDPTGRRLAARRRRFGLDLFGGNTRGAQLLGDELSTVEGGTEAVELLRPAGRRRGIGDDADGTRSFLVLRD